jgi:hypothetical protein
MILTGGKAKHSGGGKKTCPSAIWFTTNHTRTDMGSNPDLGDDSLATNRLSLCIAQEHTRETGLRVQPCSELGDFKMDHKILKRH